MSTLKIYFAAILFSEYIHHCSVKSQQLTWPLQLVIDRALGCLCICFVNLTPLASSAMCECFCDVCYNYVFIL